MSEFDKIIGYKAIKDELIQLNDMIHNRDIYNRLGARLPKGLLLYGEPGLGKTLMAKALIKESGLKTFTLRRVIGKESFVDEITATFEKAKASAPSIVFLDDLDKFANEDMDHRDAEEYVSVQAGIDEVKGCDVFVIATANEIWKLPQSLTRIGRFDRKYEIDIPSREDAAEIIKYYIADKKLSDDVNMEDLTNMISYSSCAGLETILNEAAARAAYRRRESTGMEDIIEAVLKVEYESPDNKSDMDSEKKEKIALHEAGHAVVSEAIVPGSVGLVCLRAQGKAVTKGFTRRCKNIPDDYSHAQVILAGKAAHELYYLDDVDRGSFSDIRLAANILYTNVTKIGCDGIGLINMMNEHKGDEPSESFKAKAESATQGYMERCLRETKNILLKNKKFLEAVRDELMEKEILLYSDVQRLKKKFAEF